MEFFAEDLDDGNIWAFPVGFTQNLRAIELAPLDALRLDVALVDDDFLRHVLGEFVFPRCGIVAQ